MTSINTNNSAMAALQTLRSINSNLETTQNSVSTGYRVDTASDNAAYWSIATTMRSDNKALGTVQDALGLSAAKTDTAYSGMDNAISVISEIKAKLVASREPGADKSKIDKELTELKNQLKSIAQSASFSGENWLYNDSTNAAGTKEMVGSFVRAADGSVSIKTIKFDANSSVLIDTKDETRGLLTKDYATSTTISGTATTFNYYLIDGGITATAGTGASGAEVKLSTTTTNEEVDRMVSAVDEMLKKMTDAAANLGAINKRIDLQNNFVADLSDVIDKGIGRLVDADMNEESTQLKALQTQQQLGIQALSIANNDSQNVLTLFR